MISGSINSQVLQVIFKQFVLLRRDLLLFSTESFAIDSIKIKASNHRKGVKDRDQLEKAIVRVEESQISTLDN